ncbi:hypothetical protein WDU94_015494 [Cyamophila willieti]
MDLLWFIIAVLTASTVSAAPAPSSSKGNYSVTILNDSSLGDLMGTVHTWLKLKSPNKNTTYFSFSHAKGATWKIRPGVSSVDKWLKTRKPSETFRISISERQYEQMIQAIDEFYKTKPNYSLFPESKDNSYNCVTATNKILNAVDKELV